MENVNTERSPLSASPGSASKPACPSTEIEEGMSNFDRSVDDGMAEKLKAGGVFGRHAGWNFNGKVWWHEGKFYEEVWVYGSPQQTMSADTLEELMEQVSDEYGWD